jgi:hypothetical protein
MKWTCIDYKAEEKLEIYTCKPARADRDTALAFVFESFPALPPAYKITKI